MLFFYILISISLGLVQGFLHSLFPILFIIRSLTAKIKRQLRGALHNKMFSQNTDLSSQRFRTQCGQKRNAAHAQSSVHINRTRVQFPRMIIELCPPQQGIQGNGTSLRFHMHDNYTMGIRGQIFLADFPAGRLKYFRYNSLLQVQLTPVIGLFVSHTIIVKLHGTQWLIQTLSSGRSRKSIAKQPFRLRYFTCQNQPAHFLQMSKGVRINPVHMSTIPDTVLIQLQCLFLPSTGYHRPQPPVSYRQRLLPFFRRLLKP